MLCEILRHTDTMNNLERAMPRFGCVVKEFWRDSVIVDVFVILLHTYTYNI